MSGGLETRSERHTEQANPRWEETHTSSSRSASEPSRWVGARCGTALGALLCTESRPGGCSIRSVAASA